MDRDEAADRLRHLATDRAKRSKSAQLEELFHEIEDALGAGVPQTMVLEELRAMGLDVSASTFRSTLCRLRSRQPETTTAGMPLRQASARPRFADTSGGAGPSTTVRGSLYDVDALSRLLLASAHSRRSEDVLGGWRAVPKAL